MVHQQSFATLASRYRDGTLSPVEVAASALDHAQRVDAALNVFSVLDRPRALAGAQASQARWRASAPLGPLDGMPVTVKDFAAVGGWPTRRGSALTSDEPAHATTPFVQRLLDAGMVLLGKTRAPEYNWKGVTDSPTFGVTRNPWDPTLTPGGSSGGCAAAVAAGVVRVSIGSDAGGSVRIPAAFSGVIGLKPSFGRIPVSPMPSAFNHIVHTGPIAASMRDLAEVMRVSAGPCAGDWTSFTGTLTDEVAALSEDPTRLRIGVLSPRRWTKSCAAVRRGMHDTLQRFAQAGLHVREVDVDIASASANAALFYRVGCAAVVRGVPEAARHRLDPGLLDFVAPVYALSLADYLDACGARDQHANRLAACFEHVDVLMLPTLPILPFTAGRLVPEGWPQADWMSWNPYTPAFNTAQMPALSWPVWPTGARLAVGIQCVAPRGCDHRLLALGAWLEAWQPVRLATVGV